MDSGPTRLASSAAATREAGATRPLSGNRLRALRPWPSRRCAKSWAGGRRAWSLEAAWLSCRPLAVSSKAQEHRLVQGSAARPGRSSGRSRAGSLGFPSRRWPTGRKECAAIGSERRFASGTCTQWHGTGSHACTRRAVRLCIAGSTARHTSRSASYFSSMGGVCGEVSVHGVAPARALCWPLRRYPAKAASS